MFKRLSKNWLLFIVPLVLAGCVKEAEEPMDEVQGEKQHEIVLHAGWAPETRTVLQEDGGVWWAPGDSISLSLDFHDGTGAIIKLASTNKTDSPETDFRVKYYDYEHYRNKYDDASKIAIYPYEYNGVLNSASNKSLYITIPTVQTAVAGSFDPKAFVSYAMVDDNNNLLFRNLCGGVKFSVSQEGIKEVSFRYTKTGNNYERMSGRLVYHFDDYENPDVPSPINNNRSTEVIVRAPNDTYFEVGKYYYAAMAPTSNEQQLLITFKKDTEKALYLTESKSQIQRGVFKRLYNKDEGLTFTPYTPGGAIMMSLLPNDVDESIITEVYFHPSSEHVSGVNLGTDESPVYFEQEGTVVHYYTTKTSFNLKYVTERMFCNWQSLTKVDFSGVDTSEATDFSWAFHGCTSLKSLNLDCFDTSLALNFDYMFSVCKALEKLDLSSFNTSHVLNMSGMFEGCRRLRELNLSSFDTRNCSDMGFMFNGCSSMQKLDLQNFDMTSVTDISNMCSGLAIKRKQCVIRASDSVWSKMCSSDDTQMPYASKNYFILRISPDEEFPVMVDKYAGLYKSTDYSKDYTYRTVQTATKGKGIDIVLMGDAYTDRLIDDGKYDRDMEKVIGHIFSEEPLKSLKDYFNIYITYAVSENEEIDGITAFSLVFKDFSSHIDAVFDDIYDYMCATIPNYGNGYGFTGRPEPYKIIVSNCNMHAGTTYFFTSGQTTVLMTLGTDDDDLHRISCHEFGHALGKLGDEYYQDNLTFDKISDFVEKEESGFWPNLDITNDPGSVKWSRFLSDDRYAGQGLGVYEGGYAKYAYGIWRPTENSLMRNALSGFNAPCRESLYKVVHTLADDSFVYDYETFVAFDQKAMSSSTKSTKSLNYVEKIAQPLPPPVFIETDSNNLGASTTVRWRQDGQDNN